ncbi:MAG TPA: serine hydrolase [Verrucomicrobiae bacterium]
MRSFRLEIGAGILLLSVITMFAAEPVSFAPQDARLQSMVNEAASSALAEFEGKKLLTNQFAITLVDLRDAKQPRAGSFRGGVAIYPASVVKMFYLAAAHRWMDDGKLEDSEELRRALRDMIVDSSNDATHYVLDSITGTTGGPELPEAEMKIWGEKRNAVNRYFNSLGYTHINANQKPWNDGPYGRERVWVGKDFGNRNALTTDATARLLSEMALGYCVSAKRSEEMLKLHARDFAAKGSEDDQAHGFTAPGLPRDTKLWSKAGWTNTARHDAAYVELADGRKFVLVTFTTGHAKERDIIPFVAKQIVQRL